MLLYYIFSNVLIWIILPNQHLINCPILNNKRVTNPTFLLEKNIKTAEWVVKEKNWQICIQCIEKMIENNPILTVKNILKKEN